MPSSSSLLRRAFSTPLSSTTRSNISSTSLKSLSTDLYTEQHLKKLVNKFKKSSDNDRFRTKSGIYTNTIRRLANAKRFNWIEEILEHQKQYKDISREGFVVRLLTLYGKAGMFEQARKLFDEMPDLKCQRTVLSFNAILGACVNAKKLDVLEELLRELPGNLSIELDVVSYNVIIKAFCEMGEYEKAVSMVDEMGKKGLKPDLITFNTLFNGLYRNERFSDAENMWVLMKNNGIAPDVRSYNARLLGLVLGKRMVEAIDLFEEMKNKGISPHVFSLNILIKGFCSDGNLDQAKKWYGEFEKNGISPNRVSFTTLVPFVCEKGDLGFAFELCKQIFEQKCVVDGALLQLVVEGLVKGSDLDKAKELVELGKSNCYRRYRLKLGSSTSPAIGCKSPQ